MSWSAVTAEHVRRAIAECDKLGHIDFRREYGFGEALVYDLVYEGHRHDSNPDAYSIYLIFDLGPNPKFYKLTGDMDEILDLKPVSYQARFKSP
jgi:hypothetical protein